MTDTSWVVARRRGRPPASDAAATRERILVSAREIFAEVGFEATTFHAVATRAGLTRPAVNNYFANKSLLYGEVMCQVSNGVLEGIHLAAAAPTLREQIALFVEVALVSGATTRRWPASWCRPPWRPGAGRVWRAASPTRSR